MNSKESSRAKKRFILTLCGAVFFIIILPFFIPTCSSSFRPLAILPLLPPLLWGFYALFTYQERLERIVGWFAFLVGIACLWLEFLGNLIFGIVTLLPD